jgi:autotransporter-associated beta strand protein
MVTRKRFTSRNSRGCSGRRTSLGNARARKQIPGILSLIVVALLATSSSTFAQTLSFDPTQNGTGLVSNGTNTWNNNTTADWTSGGADVTFPAAADAEFTAANQTANIAAGGGVSANSVTLSGGGDVIEGGTLTLTGTNTPNGSASGLAGGAGVVTVNGSGTTDTIDSQIDFTTTNPTQGFFVNSGNTLVLNGGATFTNSGNNILDFGGSGTYDITGGTYSSQTGNPGLIVGAGNTVINQSGGIVNPQFDATIGFAGSPTYTVSGSALFESQFGDLDVGSGSGGAGGIFNVQGGSVLIGYNQGTPTNGGNIIVAQNGGLGILNVSGGNVVQGNGGTSTTGLATGGITYLTDSASGHGVETALVNISSGTFTTAGFSFGENVNTGEGGQAPSGTPTSPIVGNTGVLNISGGTVYVGAVGINEATEAPGTVSVNLSGGTIAATANSSSSVNIALAAPATLTSGVVTPGTPASGTVTFQTADINGTAHNITLSGVISGGSTYGLTVTGTGTLALTNTANTFSGKTLVSSGATLQAASLGFSNVEVSGTNTTLQLNLNTAIAATAGLTVDSNVSLVQLNYTGIDAIQTLEVDNFNVANGTYTAGQLDALDSGAFSNVFSGGGSLEVTALAVPEPGATEMTLIGLAILFVVVRGLHPIRQLSDAKAIARSI